MRLGSSQRSPLSPAVLCLFITFAGLATASSGDRLPEFKDCVTDCISTNCGRDGPRIPLHHRALLWTCSSECDYTCQHITTSDRLSRDPPYLTPIHQFHGKWPFHRFLGLQEPFSVLFSLLNFLAHYWGISRLKAEIPAIYALRKYYLGFGYCGFASWTFSMIFHARDLVVTERLDYFAAALSVMYGLFYAPIRVFRLDRPSASATDSSTSRSSTLIRVWAVLCASLYFAHVFYLTFVRFDYTYNMAANVAVGIITNVLWTGFSVVRVRKVGRLWAAWPGLIVAWIVLAMALELFDFAPWGGMVDAHSLWHLGTVGPTVWWYNFLIKDAREDLQDKRLKA
ncbi:hypothetical protein LTR95_006800 [Oleoguttula sp. CCFEE 5521]